MISSHFSGTNWTSKHLLCVTPKAVEAPYTHTLLLPSAPAALGFLSLCPEVSGVLQSSLDQ